MDSSSWDRIASFRFTALESAVQVITNRHQGRAALERDPHHLIEELRERLTQARDDQISELAGVLSKAHILAIADLLSAGPEALIEQRAIAVGAATRSVRLAERSWRLMVTAGPCAGLQALLHRLAEAGAVERSPLLSSGSTLLQRWLASETVARGMLADRGRSTELTTAEWVDHLPRLEPHPTLETSLGRAFLARLLTEGSPPVLQAEPPAQLLRWASDLTQSERERFFSHYIISLRPDQSWNKLVVNRAFKELGEPSATNPVGAWRRIEERSPGCLVELLSWRAIQTLAAFFRAVDDPYGRFEFWRRRFGREILDARIVAAGQAALLRLPSTVVVEFRDVGNAAYLYADSEWERLLQIRASYPSAYKDRRKLLRDPATRSEARILHFEGWQMGAEQMVRRLIGRRSA